MPTKHLIQIIRIYYPVKRKLKKNYEVQFSSNLLKDNRKKNQFKKMTLVNPI